jgi:uncharacterized protein YaiE (UPF0345 family)
MKKVRSVLYRSFSYCFHGETEVGRAARGNITLGTALDGEMTVSNAIVTLCRVLKLSGEPHATRDMFRLL